MTDHAVSNGFSARRFALLARQQWQEQGRRWAAFTLVLAVLLMLAAGLALAADARALVTGAQMPVYVAGLLLSSYVFAHLTLGAWRTREASLVYLMRPASTFEKWLLMALTLLVAYPLLYSAVFGAVYAVAGELGYRIALANAEDMADIKAANFTTFLPLRPHATVTKVMRLPAQGALGLVYAGLMAYATCGLVYFRRHSGLRTLVLAIGLAIVTGLLLTAVQQSFNPRAVTAWWLPDDELGDLPLAAVAYSLLLWVGVPVLLWAASYRALRERDLS